MVLVDIGNTHFHIWQDGKINHFKKIQSFKDDVYYISVNRQKELELLALNPKAVNIKDYVKFDTDYKGLGIDRIMACKSIIDGVVVDAGSAITIDIMQKGFHKGGIIMPGIYAFKKAFGTISEVLKLNEKIITDEKLPNSTNDALNMGSVGAIKCIIEKYAKEKNLFFTGSDGKFLSKMFSNAEYIEDLVFRGMLITIKEMEKK
ncbi:type III pantothenate kinase [Nautilia lithotrophica]